MANDETIGGGFPLERCRFRGGVLRPGIAVAGLSYRTASLGLRERLAFDEEGTAEALVEFARRWPGVEAVLLSTCNRVELYLASRNRADLPGEGDVAGFLGSVRGVDPAEFASALYLRTQRAAVRHLFRVVGGLDSQIVGERQITGQVKRAYFLAVRAGTVGPILHRLFQRSFRVARLVRRSVETVMGARSVGSAAVAFAEQVLGSLAGRSVLLVGAGEMAEEALGRLRRAGVSAVLVANRTPARAEELVRRYGGSPVPFEHLSEAIARVDIVVSSTGAPGVVLSEEMMRSALARRSAEGALQPIIVLDIAVPRDVDPSVAALEGVRLFDLDSLGRDGSPGRVRRERERVAVGLRVVRREAEVFRAWLEASALDPLICRLRQHFDGVVRREGARLLSRLGHLEPAERRRIELMLRRLANKLSHQLTLVLRCAAGTGRSDRCFELLRAFLETGGEEEEKDGTSLPERN